MAAKSKSKPRGANRYTPPTKSNAPGWIWLVAGIVIGSFIMFLMKLEPKKDIRDRDGQKPVVSKNNQQGTTNAGNKPVFEFPQILSGKDTPQQPLSEEQRKVLDGQRAQALLEGAKPPTVPTVNPQLTNTTTPRAQTPTTTTQAPPTTNSQVTPTSIQPTQPTQIASVTPPAASYFFLQAGSYPTKNGAESIRAQILMLGQNVRLETTTTNNKTWYRVLVGPYKTKDEAIKAQKTLSNNGFNRTLLVPRKTQ